MKPMIYINEHEYPAPNRGLGFTVKCNLETMTNANHVTIAQRIGKDQTEVTNCVWQILDAEVWSMILQEFQSDTLVSIRYPDMIHNDWKTSWMILQEQSAEVLEAKEDGLPKTYRSCTIVLLDTGR